MSDKLVLLEERDGYAIAWEINDPEYGTDIGAYLGDHDIVRSDIEKIIAACAKPEDFDGMEHDLASRTVADFVKNMGDAVRCTATYGFRFERKSDAQKALTAAKAAVKALRERAKQVAKNSTPWPTWALQAKAAGWKPPKGWKP
jgi:hypothetical protein